MVRFRYSVIDIFKGRVMLKDCVKVRFIVNIRVNLKVRVGFGLLFCQVYDMFWLMFIVIISVSVPVCSALVFHSGQR